MINIKKTLLIVFPVIFLFSTCALEISNVIGPGGGWVFYDKKNYDGGWRYIECAPNDIGEVRLNVTYGTDGGGNPIDALQKAKELCQENSGGGFYSNSWELPDNDQLRKMLECFSYGLTQFSSDSKYISVSGDIFYKDFENELNGKVVVIDDPSNFTGVIKVRPIRKF